jgi:hypothetical protein
MRVICETCATEGQKSIVTSGGACTTLMGFQSYYDEEGVFHSHDPNRTTADFRCSRGHAWKHEMPKRKCQNCAWPAVADTPNVQFFGTPITVEEAKLELAKREKK